MEGELERIFAEEGAQGGYYCFFIADESIIASKDGPPENYMSFLAYAQYKEGVLLLWHSKNNGFGKETHIFQVDPRQVLAVLYKPVTGLLPDERIRRIQQEYYNKDRFRFSYGANSDEVFIEGTIDSVVEDIQHLNNPLLFQRDEEDKNIVYFELFNKGLIRKDIWSVDSNLTEVSFIESGGDQNKGSQGGPNRWLN